MNVLPEGGYGEVVVLHDDYNSVQGEVLGKHQEIVKRDTTRKACLNVSKFTLLKPHIAA